MSGTEVSSERRRAHRSTDDQAARMSSKKALQSFLARVEADDAKDDKLADNLGDYNDRLTLMEEKTTQRYTTPMLKPLSHLYACTDERPNPPTTKHPSNGGLTD